MRSVAVNLSTVIAAVMLMTTDAQIECQQEFNSADGKVGTFTSRHYGNYELYPHNTECLYTFHGLEGERVQITVNDIDLVYTSGDPTDPWDCENEDSLTMFNEIPQSSGSQDGGIVTFCGERLPPVVMSDSSNMAVSLQTLDNSEETGRGFSATYKFVTDFGVLHTGTQEGDGNCRFTFQSDQTGNGTFSSPNGLGLYPRNTHCTYIFRGGSGQIVYIRFTDFDVEGIPPLCSSSTVSDSVVVGYNPQGNQDKLDRILCGDIQPFDSQLSVFSIGHFIVVSFKSNVIYDAFGFNATYEFVQL